MVNIQVAALAPSVLEVIDESESHRGHAGYRDGGESHFRIRMASPAFTGALLQGVASAYGVALSSAQAQAIAANAPVLHRLVGGDEGVFPGRGAGTDK